MSNVGAITVSKGKYLGREGLELSDSIKRVFITHEAGGRILYYGPHDFNILYEVDKLSTPRVNLQAENSSELKNKRIDAGWINYGGYKTWVAPQEKWEGPPYLDLDSADYEMGFYEKENNDIFIVQVSPICRETGLQIKREINIESNKSGLTIRHYLTQTTEAFDFWGIWDVTQVNKPCKVIFNGTPIKFEPFTQNATAENYIFYDRDNDNIICECPENDKDGYKAYFTAKKGKMFTEMSYMGKKLVYSKTFKNDPSVRYAHGSNIEVYSDFNKNYAEVEVHSPLFTFAKDSKNFYFDIKWGFTVI